jgi:hypothetical protein
MDFETALYSQLQALPAWTINQARLARIIERSGPVSAAVTGNLEQTVRAKLGIDPACSVDWTAMTAPGKKGTVDWAALLQFIEQVLPLILPLIEPLITA